jgi:hypothetical protein
MHFGIRKPFVPEGHVRIARRFNAGKNPELHKSRRAGRMVCMSYLRILNRFSGVF